jgi:hypothetical protein
LGDGVPQLARGGPPGGVPGADPSSGPGYEKNPPHEALGGPPDRKSTRLNSSHSV